MAKVGAWWVREADAEPDEQVVWSRAANRTQSSSRAVGGKLFLTDRRLVFCPQWIDAITGGQRWSVGLSEVSGVGVQPKGGDRLGGGLRDRLRLELADGGHELFVINHLSELVERLDGARQGSAEATP